MFWKLGDSLSAQDKELNHHPSPLKHLLTTSSDMLQSLAKVQDNLEENVHNILNNSDKPLHNLVMKDYRTLQKDRENYRKKQRDLETATNKYRKEKEKREGLPSNYLYKDIQDNKEQRYLSWC